MDNRSFKTLLAFLKNVPSIDAHGLSYGDKEGMWWVKFTIDTAHYLSWNTVQELGHVINHLSLEKRLPAAFYPISPPPYLNGGPEEHLTWIIATQDKKFKPNTLTQWLEGRLPSPVDDLSKWIII